MENLDKYQEMTEFYEIDFTYDDDDIPDIMSGVTYEVNKYGY